ADATSPDVVSLSLRVFFVRTVEDFVEFVKVRQPDPETGQPDLERILGFLGGHPEAQTALNHAWASWCTLRRPSRPPSCRWGRPRRRATPASPSTACTCSG